MRKRLPPRNHPEYSRLYYLLHKKKILKDGCARQKKFRRDFRKYVTRGEQVPDAIIRDIYSRRRTASLMTKKPWGITLKGFLAWWRLQPMKCHYCKRPFSETVNDGDRFARQFYPSIDRVNNSKGYFLWNIALTCSRCNFIKSNLFSEKEMLTIGAMVRRIFRTRGLTLRPRGSRARQ